VTRQGIFFAELNIDHRQKQPLALKRRRQEQRNDHMFDVSLVELSTEAVSQMSNRRLKIS